MSIVLSENPSGATLSGTTVRQAIGGVANFDDLRIDRIGVGFRLRAVAEGFAEAASQPFDVLEIPTRGIAYVAQEAIYLMNADGSGAVHWLPRGEDPAVSPDGSKIAFSRPAGMAERQIWVADMNGSDVRRLTTSTTPDGEWFWSDRSPTWSPDGETIAFSRSDGPSAAIYSVRPDGSGLARLSPVEGPGVPRLQGFHFHSPAWSPAGTRLAFSGYDEWAEAHAIYAMNADGSEIAAITSRGEQPLDPAWSPDGRLIAFSKDDRLYVMNAEGTDVRRLMTGGADATEPSWSPDGTRIAFVGDGDIHVMNADGTALANLTRTPGIHETSPSWLGR